MSYFAYNFVLFIFTRYFPFNSLGPPFYGLFVFFLSFLTISSMLCSYFFFLTLTLIFSMLFFSDSASSWDAFLYDASSDKRLVTSVKIATPVLKLMS